MKTIRNITCRIAILLAVLMLNSCEKGSKTNDYDKLIQGTWILISTDNVIAESDKRFVLDFADGKQGYSVGYMYDGSREWKRSDKYSYQFDQDMLTIEGTNADGVATYLKVKINSIDATRMIYDIVTLKYDGEDVTSETAVTHTFMKAGADFGLLGVWEGVESGVEATRRFEFLADGRYKYYYKQDGEFVEKTDNDGTYFMYGSFLVCNYNNEIDSTQKGRIYECWDLGLDGDILYWRGINNGVEGTLSMKRL